MRNSIRTKFTMGMVFLFVIILVLAVCSGYFMNKLSNKTSAILSENYQSVVYAREMTDGITNINLEITSSYLAERKSDSLKIMKELGLIDKSLQQAKNNLTEPGEEKLVSEIEAGFMEYRDSVYMSLKLSYQAEMVLYLQNISGDLYRQILLLSEINGKALEVKTDDAKAASKSANTQMTILATICFLIGLSFAYSFGLYFNQRLFQLYSGIKDIVSSNYSKKLFFEGDDELSEISVIFNEMAEKLDENKQKISVILQEDIIKGLHANDVYDLQKLVSRIKDIEELAAALLSKFEKK